MPGSSANQAIAERVAQTISEAQNNSKPLTLPAMLPALYQELRRMGRSLLRRERVGHTLQPTAIVNEAYLRLAGIDPQIHDQKHAFRLLVQTMRRVLIDHARAKRRDKREAPAHEILEALSTQPFIVGSTPIDACDVDSALSALGQRSEIASEMVQLRYLLGLEDPEIAALLSVSEPTVTRTLRMAKAWLTNYICGGAAAADAAQDAASTGRRPRLRAVPPDGELDPELEE